MIKINIMTNESPYWESTINFAEKCSWKAGVFLAKAMRENSFKSYERVISVCDDDKVVGFCTFTEKDELPEKYDMTPFIGFVFVDEEYRGMRLSEQMINTVGEYAYQQGFSQMYIFYGEIGLYEKYGFEKVSKYETIWGNMKLFGEMLSSYL